MTIFSKDAGESELSTVSNMESSVSSSIIEVLSSISSLYNDELSSSTNCLLYIESRLPFLMLDLRLASEIDFNSD